MREKERNKMTSERKKQRERQKERERDEHEKNTLNGQSLKVENMDKA